MYYAKASRIWLKRGAKPSTVQHSQATFCFCIACQPGCQLLAAATHHLIKNIKMHHLTQLAFFIYRKLCCNSCMEELRLHSVFEGSAANLYILAGPTGPAGGLCNPWL